MIYAIYGLCGVSLLQCVALAVLMKRRKGMDAGRIETRLSHFAEALALLTDTTQSGFTTVAAELERMTGGHAPVVNRAAASKRIVSAARKGRSIQDIAAAEAVSESEIRLTLGIASTADAPVARKTSVQATPVDASTAAAEVTPTAATPATPARPRVARPTRKIAKPMTVPEAAAVAAPTPVTPAPVTVVRTTKPATMPAVVHEQARRPRARVVGSSLNIGA